MSHDQQHGAPLSSAAYLEEVARRSADAMMDLAQSHFADHPEVDHFVGLATKLLGSQNAALIRVWRQSGTPETRRLVWPAGGDDWSTETGGTTISQIVGTALARDYPTDGPDGGTDHGPSPRVTRGQGLEIDGKRAVAVGVRMDICQKRFDFALALWGRERGRPPRLTEQEGYTTYDCHFLRPLLAVALRMLRANIEYRMAEFTRLSAAGSVASAAAVGVELLKLKGQWHIPCDASFAADALERYVQACPRDFADASARAYAWRELGLLRDIARESAPYPDYRGRIEPLLHRAGMALLLSDSSLDLQKRVAAVDGLLGPRPGD